ncbi:unnamed protein product [Gordionus sp. m RMFG-2023]
MSKKVEVDPSIHGVSTTNTRKNVKLMCLVQPMVNLEINDTGMMMSAATVNQLCSIQPMGNLNVNDTVRMSSAGNVNLWENLNVNG